MSIQKYGIMQIFSQRLKELRAQSGLTQQQVAEKLNIRQQSYARYEYGSGEPNLETVVKLSHMFDVSCDYLLGESDF